jgi:hypothetical protein
MGRRQCELEDCSKWAESGGIRHCRAHGGGKWCQEETAPSPLKAIRSTSEPSAATCHHSGGRAHALLSKGLFLTCMVCVAIAGTPPRSCTSQSSTSLASRWTR